MPEIISLSNYLLNLYAVPTGITGISVLILGIVILRRERLSYVSIPFFLSCFVVSIWLIAFSIMYCSAYPAIALWWAKFAYFGVPFISPAFYHFTVAVLGFQKKYGKAVVLCWITGALFCLTIVTSNALIKGVYNYWWGYYPKYGWLSIPYLLGTYAFDKPNSGSLYISLFPSACLIA